MPARNGERRARRELEISLRRLAQLEFRNPVLTPATRRRRRAAPRRAVRT